MKNTRFLCIMAIAALTSWLLAACNLPISSITVGTDTTAPTIGNLITSSKSVYYNDTSCGPTTLTIIMSVGDDSGFIQSAGVQYRYNDYGQSGIPMDSWRTLNLLSNGDGRFSGTVDVAKEAGTLLDGVGAALEYQAFAVDSAGNIQTVPSETIYSLIVQSCKSGVVGSSPVSNSANAPVSPPKPSSGAGNSPTA
ncbi:MAG: hypothetical protein H8E28_02180, partial [Anaerolineae bacterium]|nr:hypothetical protein [Anaerolineae bacterium]